MKPALTNTTTGYEVSLIGPYTLRIHEAVDSDYVRRLGSKILAGGCICRPLAVERKTLVLLDGHHRHAAALQLGLSSVPCILIDYDDPRIEVSSWRKDYPVSRALVMAIGLSDGVMPRKTSRHVFTPDLGEAPVALPMLRELAATA